MPGPIEQAIPHEAVKLSNIRKTIARRLTEAKQQVPHIYLTVDIQLDALLKLRGELNKGLESRNIKLSVNDLMIKALAQSLIEVPECNVGFAGDQMLKYSRADISVAVSIPAGLITPIIVDADSKSVSAISTEMKDLAGPRQGGQAPAAANIRAAPRACRNMGMYGIKKFEAVINPPQGMIMAIGAGEKRPYVINDSLQIATVMSATGSFDHRAIDGADGAQADEAFKAWSKTRWGCWLERSRDDVPVIRVTAMPADTNPYGGVFGGWLMGQMGLACGSFASRRTQGKAILVAADAIKFPGAMAVGDELSVYVDLLKQGGRRCG